MQTQYKVILTSRNIYKEIILSANNESVLVGTGTECDVRLPQNIFFEPFLLHFYREEDGWTIRCNEKVYLSSNTINRFPQMTLKHGDEYAVKYSSSDAEFLTLNYLIDFDAEGHAYNMSIDLHGQNKIIIGGKKNADIYIKSEFIKDSYVVLSMHGRKVSLNDVNTCYGVYLNGVKMQEETILEDNDFFSVAYCSFFYRDGKLYTDKKNKLRIERLKTREITEQNSCLTYPKFNRNSRRITVLNDEPIPVLEPPAKPQKPKENLFLMLFPIIAMVILTVLMRGAMGGSAYLAFSVCSMGLGGVTSVMAFVSNRKQYKKDCMDRIEIYQQYIEKKRAEIQDARKKELEELNEIYLNYEAEKRLVKTFSSQLFERSLEDSDFAAVYLGKGARKAVKRIEYKEQEKLEVDDELAELPLKLSEDFAFIKNAPITLSLKDNDAVGIVGTVANCYSMLKNITYDLAVRHFPEDMHFYYICSEPSMEMIKWVRWLPHTKNQKLDLYNIACDSKSINLIFEELFIQLSAAKPTEKDECLKSYNIIFVFDDMGIREHPLSQYIKNAKSKGYTFIFFEQNEGLLPKYCESIICLDTFGKSGTITETKNQQNSAEFSFRAIPDEEAVATALKLSPVYCEELSLEGGLAKKYSFYQMLNIFEAKEIDVEANWNSEAIYKTLAAPLGINAKNEIVSLDLHENAHGPHGLVAGTTGSGKSEILQSYILSMAIRYHPDDVGFVIIDFKGGGMANQFAELPHLIGTITNIDGREIDRSLKSIKAELQKRQLLFAEYNVNKIDAYIKKYKTGEASTPLPHLIIVVDEFAELKADQPEFMKELISAARIGRSLGVHLILATQKPAGQVDEQIWSNSKFKLCLKVQDKEDSNEVLKSPLAAEIREPGRAYLQVGNNEIFMLFQSAYSGGSIFTDENAGGHEFKLEEVNLWGKKTVIYQQKRKKYNEAVSDKNQLEAIVEYISAYCQSHHIQRLPSICLPSLEKVIVYSRHEGMVEAGCVDIGIYDDPENQSQNSVMLDISTKNTFILGASQFGKTNLLQVIMRSVIENMTPEEANIYIIDFGSRILKNYESAKHVGGVVCSNEDEKLKNLFKLLDSEITGRKEKLAAIGVSSYSAYREAGYTDIPQIYLIIDNLTALIELYLEDDDSLLVFIREGAAVGITAVVANAQTNGISYKYLSNFSNKIVFYCNDSGEYSSIFDHVSIQPRELPGRCILEMDKRMLECQTYLAFEGEKEIERVTMLQQVIETVNSQNMQNKARQIPFIPAILSRTALLEDYGTCTEGYQIPIGLDYSEVEPYYFKINQLGAIGLCGKEGSGHRNFVEYIIRNFQEHLADWPVEICIIDDITHKYENLKELSIVKTYTLDSEKAVDIIHDWYERLTERYQLMLEGNTEKKQPLLLMIIQNNDTAKIVSDNMSALDEYNEIISRYRTLNVCFLYANYENASVSYDAPEPLHRIKEEQHLLLFDNLSDLKVFEPDYEALKKYRKKLGTGDAYYIKGNDIVRLKLVLNS